ncbi:MAG TPA: NADH-quinone oxidoreductase subunit J [Ktedonobacterales bacterium]|nr:NADH-quinone oxidoreductase subunit J [Ktedonobacterales bacterium]
MGSVMLFQQISFYVLAAMAIGSALGVIFFRNAVYSMLSLILNLLSLEFFFLTLQALFVATIQVLIYAGAVMVLFLFVVTMLAPSANEDVTGRDRLRWQRSVGISMGVILAVALCYAAFSGALASDVRATGGARLAAQVASVGNTQAFGLALFHGYSFPFEVTGVLLVIAVLGAVALGRRPGMKE